MREIRTVRDCWDALAEAGLPRLDAVDDLFRVARVAAKLLDEHDALRARVAELEALINTPQTVDFLEAVRIEAAHQRERWGEVHDAHKTPEDWFWVVGYLAGKAIRPDVALEKRQHRIIALAALCLNWHRHERAREGAQGDEG